MAVYDIKRANFHINIAIAVMQIQLRNVYFWGISQPHTINQDTRHLSTISIKGGNVVIEETLLLFRLSKNHKEFTDTLQDKSHFLTRSFKKRECILYSFYR